MRSKLSLLLWSVSVATAAHAAPLTCPDRSIALQVGACPTEAELQYTFNGYCSDNARLDDNDGEVCINFEAYLARKNNALWESADGVFSGYLTCNRPTDALREATSVGMSVRRQGTLNLVECVYSDGGRLTYRTKAQCALERGDCTATEGCVAQCD